MGMSQQASDGCKMMNRREANYNLTGGGKKAPLGFGHISLARVSFFQIEIKYSTSDYKQGGNDFSLRGMEAKYGVLRINPDFFNKKPLNSIDYKIKRKQGTWNTKFFTQRPDQKK